MSRDLLFISYSHICTFFISVVEFILCDKSKINGQFKASDIDILNFQVSNLQTAIGKYDSAILRAKDIVFMEISLSKGLENSSKAE